MKLWKTWNGDKELPKIGFEKELLIVKAGHEGKGKGSHLFLDYHASGRARVVYKIVKINRGDQDREWQSIAQVVAGRLAAWMVAMPNQPLHLSGAV